MKSTFKTLTVAATCTLPLIEPRAWPTMTREQLKAALEAIRKESAELGDPSFAIKEIEYSEDGMPRQIKSGSNVTPEWLNLKLAGHLKPFSLNIRDGKDFGKTGERLEALSEPLSVDTLKNRGVDTDQLKKLGIKKVREITFNSILKSNFFNDAQRNKAKAWFNNKEELEKTIEDYANNYPYDLLGSCCIIDYITDNWKSDFPFIYCVTPKSANCTLRHSFMSPDEIRVSLKEMLLRKNGKEKVILLLLLDEATPSEHRLKWGRDTHNPEGSYQPDNVITIDKQCSLSHEIGHYLQMHFGLVQTLENYQTEFAKRLLLLNNPCPQDPNPSPLIVREFISGIDGAFFRRLGEGYFKCPEMISLNKVFCYLQLLIRWHSTVEISNILGVYFNNETLYLNTLSDIRELKRIRYAHNTKSFGRQIIEGLNTSSLPKRFQAFLKSAFILASGMPLPTEMLELLCQLHDRPPEDAQSIACVYDCEDKKEFNEKIKPLLSDFIKAK